MFSSLSALAHPHSPSASPQRNFDWTLRAGTKEVLDALDLHDLDLSCSGQGVSYSTSMLAQRNECTQSISDGNVTASKYAASGLD